MIDLFAVFHLPIHQIRFCARQHKIYPHTQGKSIRGTRREKKERDRRVKRGNEKENFDYGKCDLYRDHRNIHTHIDEQIQRSKANCWNDIPLETIGCTWMSSLNAHGCLSLRKRMKSSRLRHHQQNAAKTHKPTFSGHEMKFNRKSRCCSFVLSIYFRFVCAWSSCLRSFILTCECVHDFLLPLYFVVQLVFWSLQFFFSLYAQLSLSLVKIRQKNFSC